MIQRKICMLGAFAVGKTSLVRRFVHSLFTERYHTTVGVKVDKKQLNLGDSTVNLLLWDVAGDDEFQTLRPSYLRGSAGFLFVVDGTRRATLDRALAIYARAQAAVGDVPRVIALNKSDLTDDWELTDQDCTALTNDGWKVFVTSAKSGTAVNDAFEWLARQTVLAGDD